MSDFMEPKEPPKTCENCEWGLPDNEEECVSKTLTADASKCPDYVYAEVPKPTLEQRYQQLEQVALDMRNQLWDLARHGWHDSRDCAKVDIRLNDCGVSLDD